MRNQSTCHHLLVTIPPCASKPNMETACHQINCQPAIFNIREVEVQASFFRWWYGLGSPNIRNTNVNGSVLLFFIWKLHGGAVVGLGWGKYEVSHMQSTLHWQFHCFFRVAVSWAAVVNVATLPMLGGMANITHGSMLLHVAVSLFMNRITFLQTSSSFEDVAASRRGLIF